MSKKNKKPPWWYIREMKDTWKTKKEKRKDKSWDKQGRQKELKF